MISFFLLSHSIFSILILIPPMQNTHTYTHIRTFMGAMKKTKNCFEVFHFWLDFDISKSFLLVIKSCSISLYFQKNHWYRWESQWGFLFFPFVNREVQFGDCSILSKCTLSLWWRQWVWAIQTVGIFWTVFKWVRFYLIRPFVQGRLKRGEMGCVKRGEEKIARAMY